MGGVHNRANTATRPSPHTHTGRHCPRQSPLRAPAHEPPYPPRHTHPRPPRPPCLLPPAEHTQCARGTSTPVHQRENKNGATAANGARGITKFASSPAACGVGCGRGGLPASDGFVGFIEQCSLKRQHCWLDTRLHTRRRVAGSWWHATPARWKWSACRWKWSARCFGGRGCTW